jgi:hypothetical protein
MARDVLTVVAEPTSVDDLDGRGLRASGEEPADEACEDSQAGESAQSKTSLSHLGDLRLNADLNRVKSTRS